MKRRKQGTITQIQVSSDGRTDFVIQGTDNHTYYGRFLLECTQAVVGKSVSFEWSYMPGTLTRQAAYIKF